MKKITNLIINDFKIFQLGVDFLGYKVTNKQDLSYHHLIVPKRSSGKMTYENGAILNETTSHPYLHLIEAKDYEIFCYITSEMIDEKVKGRIDYENLVRIRDLLTYFEKEHINDITSKGKHLIKEEYIKGRVII